MYQVHLSGWGDVAKVERGKSLCYLPVKVENLNEPSRKKISYHE